MNKTLQYFEKRFDRKIEDRALIEVSGINRTIMAQILAELGVKRGVEVGVAEGYHAEVLCKNIPGLELDAIDCYEIYPGYSEYKDPESVWKDAIKRLEKYNVLFKRQFSTDAVKDYQDNSLDFVYIDSAHDFKTVAEDVYEWTKKVKPQGIVFGHDYKNHRQFVDKGIVRHPVHVRSVIDAYVACMGIRPLFFLLNDVNDPTFGRDNKGWMFVKP